MHSQFVVPDRYNSILTTVPSTIIDCAAACAESYPGKFSVWRNKAQFKSGLLDTNPQSSGPMLLGSSPANPTFTGYAGTKGAYWALNGSQFMYYSGRKDNGYVDGCWNNMHKTTGNQPFTVVLALYYLRNASSSQALMSTKATDAGSKGVLVTATTAHKLNLTQRGDTATVNKASTATIPDATNIILGLGSDGSQTSFWIGSSTAETVANAFNATTTDATNPMIFGAEYDLTINTGAFPLVNGTKIYDICMFNSLLSDSDMAKVITAIEARNGIDFTP